VVLDTLPTLPEGRGADDPHDTFFLSMVWASQADYLVTGDHRAGLLPMGHFGRTRIATPSVFCMEALG